MSPRSSSDPRSLAATLLLALLMVGLLIGGALLLLPSSAIQAAPSVAGWDQPVWVWLEPSSAQIVTGELVTVTIKVGIAPGISGAQYRIHFDPNVLTVVDADPAKPGTQIGGAEIFARRNTLEAQNNADNATGVINYAIIIVSDQPANGPGNLGQITFRGKNSGLSRVYFDTDPRYSGLSQYTGSPFNTTWNGGLFAVNGYLKRLYLPLVLCRR